MQRKVRRHLAHLPSFEERPLVFFTVCTAKRIPLLACEECQSILVNSWKISEEVDAWQVGRYVLMRDHVHLFARPLTEATLLSKWVGTWKSVTSRNIAKTLSIPPPIWQEDYFDRYLRHAESYAEKWEYVRLNPVRAGLAKYPEEWPWQGEIHRLDF